MNIILVGAAASGKDYLKKKLIERGFIPSISHTTRPPRAGEKEGVDYYFKDLVIFKNLINSGHYLEYQHFNSWYYGTPHPDFITDRVKKVGTPNLFIMTPGGIAQLPEDFRKKSLVIYLDTDWELRLQRLEERGDKNDSIERRMEADTRDFSNFFDYNIRIEHPNQLKF